MFRGEPIKTIPGNVIIGPKRLPIKPQILYDQEFLLKILEI